MIPRIVALSLLCALLCALLEGLGFRSKKLFATLCAVLLMISAMSSLSEIFGVLGDLAQKTGIGDAAASAMRAIGLGYVFGFTADICSSLGETTIASLVTAVGRVEMFLIAYPYFEKTVNLALGLLK